MALTKRISYSFVTMLVIICTTFVLMKIIPGDPFTDERALPKEIHKSLRVHYGLEDPWPTQLKKYFNSLIHFKFGPSFTNPDLSVNDIICEGFQVSLILGLEALFFAITLGLAFGTISALYHNRFQDTALMTLATLGISLPSFIFAAFLQYGLSLKLGLFPTARWGTFSHSVLPAIALALQPTAFLSRIIRSNLIEALTHDAIYTAKSKGLPMYRIVFKHALPLAIVPIFPYLGQMITNILMGSFIIEKIFAIPGLGSWVVNSVSNRDYTVIMGVTIFYSFLLLGLGVIMDFLYIKLDPRQSQTATSKWGKFSEI